MSVVPHPSSRAFADVADALAALAAGKLVVVADGDGDDDCVSATLVMAADQVTAAHVEFMSRHANGWTCIALEAGRCDELGLESLEGRLSASQTGLAVTIAARDGLTDHVSPRDQAHTMRVAADASKGARDIVKGGHVSPVRARPGGLFERVGIPEAAVDLARLAGCAPAGVICPIDGPDEVTTSERVADYCMRHSLNLISLSSVVAYRGRYDRLVGRVVETRLPTTFGDFEAVGYEGITGMGQYVALVRGEVRGAENTLVRVHSECLAGDVFGSLRCDCAAELRRALERISIDGGVVVYLSRSGAEAGVRTLSCWDDREARIPDFGVLRGNENENREHAVTTQILRDLGVGTVRLLASRAGEAAVLERYGVEVTEEITMVNGGGGATT